MARRGKKNRTRDTFDISNAPALRFEKRPVAHRGSPKSDFSESDILKMDDRRRYHPEGGRRPTNSIRRESRHLIAVPNRSNPTKTKPYRTFSYSQTVFNEPPARVSYKIPSEVTVCVRRSRRRQVMFAKNKAGKAGQKKPHWNSLSRTQCRRK